MKFLRERKWSNKKMPKA
jgi:hypothetical protein